MASSVKTEIEKLRDELRRHNRLYFVEAKPEITDLEFDKLMARLVKLESEHPEYDSPDSPSKQVGGTAVEGFETVEHRIPMLSIDNVYDEKELDEFDARIRKLVTGEPIEYAVEYKVDGVAIAVTYEKGLMVQAVTRGDGTRGDDITNNARTIRGLPLRLRTKKPPALLEVRGEAYISNSDFAKLRADPHRARGSEASRQSSQYGRGGAQAAGSETLGRSQAAILRARNGGRRGDRIPNAPGISEIDPRLGRSDHAQLPTVCGHREGPRGGQRNGERGPHVGLRSRWNRAEGQ